MTQQEVSEFKPVCGMTIDEATSVCCYASLDCNSVCAKEYNDIPNYEDMIDEAEYKYEDR